jgi:hypothetical protein
VRAWYIEYHQLQFCRKDLAILLPLFLSDAAVLTRQPCVVDCLANTPAARTCTAA